jgi:hypothetical protein
MCIRNYAYNVKGYQNGIKELVMATTSFEKNFVVTDPNAIRAFKENCKKAHKVTTNNRNHEADRVKGIALLRQRLSHSQI